VDYKPLFARQLDTKKSLEGLFWNNFRAEGLGFRVEDQRLEALAVLPALGNDDELPPYKFPAFISPSIHPP